MHNLRAALGKEGENDDLSVSRGNPSKTFNKSKNGSMWALDPDEDDDEQKMRDFNFKRSKDIESKIMSTFQKESTFSEIIFFEIIEQIQTISEELDELARLQMIEKTVEKMNEGSPQSLKDYLSSFLECLVRRIKKLKKKQKKIELQEYDKIVKTNFKKKNGAQFIDEDHLDNKETPAKQNAIVRNSGINARSNNSKSTGKKSTSKRNGSTSSTEGKLGKLISSGTLKQEKRQEENEEAHDRQQESVGFASVVSQSMVVRQRKPPSKKEKKQKEEKGAQKQQGESEGIDEAFIFYRPKAGKKK